MTPQNGKIKNTYLVQCTGYTTNINVIKNRHDSRITRMYTDPYFYSGTPGKGTPGRTVPGTTYRLLKTNFSSKILDGTWLVLEYRRDRPN